jgi:hypothetical protein
MENYQKSVRAINPLSTRPYAEVPWIEYDTCMPEQSAVRVRVLPNGNPEDASVISWRGRLLELNLSGRNFPLGTLFEIENGAMVYLGELQQQTGSVLVVAIEHSVDCERLKPIQEAWG